jgi:hypothetical protein
MFDVSLIRSPVSAINAISAMSRSPTNVLRFGSASSAVNSSAESGLIYSWVTLGVGTRLIGEASMRSSSTHQRKNASRIRW